MKHIITDSAGFAEASKTAGVVVIVFTKREVEAGLISDAFDRLSNLSDTRENLDAFQGRVTFAFHGYDGDSREIYEFPECVQFFRAVVDQWPYWFHFIETKADTMPTLMALLCDCKVVKAGNGRTASTFKSIDQVETEMLKLYSAMNLLHDLHGISEDKNREISSNIEGALARSLGI